MLSDEIKDLYSAEKQLTKAIPKMVKGAHDASLKAAVAAHLKETEDQVTRLEKAAELLNIKPTGKKCVGMEGCIKEGAEALEEEGADSILDSGSSARADASNTTRCGYKTAISLAQRTRRHSGGYSSRTVPRGRSGCRHQVAADRAYHQQERASRRPQRIRQWEHCRIQGAYFRDRFSEGPRIGGPCRGGTEG